LKAVFSAEVRAERSVRTRREVIGKGKMERKDGKERWKGKMERKDAHRPLLRNGKINFLPIQ
jgi:hypothetical protein